MKKNRGITLIALIITIIVLLILAGVTVSQITGDNRLFSFTKNAKEKDLEAQENEKNVLENYEDNINKFFDENKDNKDNQDNENNNDFFESTEIKNVQLKITDKTINKLEGTINITGDDNIQILDYHLYMEKPDGTKTAYTFSKNTFVINELERETTYSLYAIVCSSNGTFKKSETIKETTLATPLITIDSAKYMYVINNYNISDASKVENVLFDKNIKNAGKYSGVLFAVQAKSYIEITISKNSIIYAYSNYYTDSGGSSGGKVKFDKWNGTSYESYKICNTNSDGNKYELVTLEPGKYKVSAKTNYVNFDEWEVIETK